MTVSFRNKTDYPEDQINRNQIKLTIMSERLLKRFFFTCCSSHSGKVKNKENVTLGWKKHFQQQGTVNNSRHLFSGNTNFRRALNKNQKEGYQRKTIKKRQLWEETKKAYYTQPGKSRLRTNVISLCKYMKNYLTMAQRINFVGNQEKISF